MDLVAPHLVGFSRTKDWNRVSCIGRQILYHWATREALCISFCIDLSFQLIWVNIKEYNCRIICYAPALIDMERGQRNLESKAERTSTLLPTPLLLLTPRSLWFTWKSPRFCLFSVSKQQAWRAFASICLSFNPGWLSLIFNFQFKFSEGFALSLW